MCKDLDKYFGLFKLISTVSEEFREMEINKTLPEDIFTDLCFIENNITDVKTMSNICMYIYNLMITSLSEKGILFKNMDILLHSKKLIHNNYAYLICCVYDIIVNKISTEPNSEIEVILNLYKTHITEEVLIKLLNNIVYDNINAIIDKDKILYETFKLDDSIVTVTSVFLDYLKEVHNKSILI